MGEPMISGTAIGAIVGGLAALIGVAIVLIMAARRKPSFDVKVRRSGTFAAPMRPGDAIDQLEAQAKSVGLKVDIVDKPGSRLLLSDGVSLFSFGHFVPVSVEASGDGARVTVSTATKIPQYGPVVTRNHKKILVKVKRALEVAG